MEAHDETQPVDETEAGYGDDSTLSAHDATQETDPAALTEEQEANRDSENATQGDQGPAVREQDATATGPGAVASADPNQPVAASPPPPEAQSGVPGIPENEGVTAPGESEGASEGE